MPRWLRRLLLALAVLLGLGALGVLGLWLWIRVPPQAATRDEAIAAFTAVMNGATDQRPDALGKLAGALEDRPDDAKLWLWYGLANLHGFLEHREMPYAIRASRAFERAAELDPADPSNEGWRAFFAYQAAESREESMEEPTRELLAASAADPSFTSFLAAVSLADLPLDTGLPQRTLAPLEGAADCGDGTTHTCRTSPLNPHGAEGFHVTLGDLRIRLGDLEGGQESYARARTMPAVASWPYRAAFEEWAVGAEDRARRFADEDPTNDPEHVFFATGERACATCHER